MGAENWTFPVSDIYSTLNFTKNVHESLINLVLVFYFFGSQIQILMLKATKVGIPNTNFCVLNTNFGVTICVPNTKISVKCPVQLAT